MRFEGVLVAWNPEAGYGAIRPAKGGDEVFVGLGAFPMDGEGPRLDEALSFEIVSRGDGRKQAVQLKRLVSAPQQPVLREAGSGAKARARRALQKRRLTWAAVAVVSALVVVAGFTWWQPARVLAEVVAGTRH